MKALKINLTVLAALLTLNWSCVSNKKYHEAISDRNKKYNELQADYGTLAKNKATLEAASAEALKNDERLLNEKQKALNEEQQKMQEMKEFLNAQHNAIANLNRKYAVPLNVLLLMN